MFIVNDSMDRILLERCDDDVHTKFFSVEVVLKCLKLGIVVLVMFNKMLVIVFIIDLISGYGPRSKKPSLSICAHFLHSMLKMGQVLVLKLMSP